MLKIIFIIFNHPLNKGHRLRAVNRFIFWQIFSRIFKYPVLLPYTDKSSYFCWNGLTGLTGNWYYGLMEMEEMSFLLHFIRDQDCFFDIGSNVGAFSILASQHSKAEVHAFEPHPQTFKYLERNIKVQKNTKNIQLHNFALGDEVGSLLFSSDLDTANHIATELDKNVISIRVDKLDNLKLTQPDIIKIDVEGFEMNVLKGGLRNLNDHKLKAIIIELNGSGLRYNIEDGTIDKLLRDFGFEPCTYDPFTRQLIKLNEYLSHNTIYVRDFEFCSKRCLSSDCFYLANGVKL
jgi:FkbM family methyltransferase